MKSIVTPLPSLSSAMARARSEKNEGAFEHADQMHAIGMVAADVRGKGADARAYVVGSDECLHVVKTGTG